MTLASVELSERSMTSVKLRGEQSVMKLASVELSERSMTSLKLRGEQSVMKLMWLGVGSFVSSLG